MTTEDLEGRMRDREYFHGMRLVPGAWTVIRVDGRSFSRFTESRFDKPFDERFRTHMLAAASALVTEFNAPYGYTESDEISILLPPSWSLFDREVEKSVSLSAGIASAAFSVSCGEAAHFDSRIWVGTCPQDVIDYFRWRQADAGRCALNGWCYWTLRNGGADVAEATRRLVGLAVSDKNELLFAHGINFNELPLWQRRGVGLYWSNQEKEGFNPVTQTKTTALRRGLKTDLELPLKEAYDELLRSILQNQD